MPPKSAPSQTYSGRGITQLYADLGFSKDDHLRNIKTIDSALKNCPIEKLDRDDPPLYKRTDSREARELATDFFEKEGKTFWPESSKATWPKWSKDRDEIIGLLAAVLSNKAFNKFYRNKTIKETSKIQKEPRPRINGPVQHKAASLKTTQARRPVKSVLQTETPAVASVTKPYEGTVSQQAIREFVPNMVLPTSSGDSEPDFHTKCIEHIKRLRLKNTQVIFKFTEKWLKNPSIQYTPSIDARIERFMHSKRIYNPEAEDVKLVDFVRRLRKGTVFEVLDNTLDVKTIEERILERIRHLAIGLWREGFICSETGGKYSPAAEFERCWADRKDIWRQAEASSPTGKVCGIPADEPMLPSVRSQTLFVGTPAPELPAPDLSMSQLNVVTPSTPTPKTNAKQDELRRSENEYPSPPPSKRRRLSPPPESSDVVPENSQTLEAAIRMAPLTDVEENIYDAEPDENIEFAQEFLASSETLERQKSPSRTLTPPRETPPERRPMTPESPIFGSRPLNNDGQPVFAMDAPVTRKDSPETRTIHPISPIQSTTAKRPKPEIVLVLQDASMKYNISSPVHISRIRHSSRNNFFGLVAQRCGMFFADIESLTFRFLFAETIIAETEYRIYSSDGEEKWDVMKENLRTCAEICHAIGVKGRFMVLVDVGDGRGLQDEDLFASQR